jgi:hypothetical protein
MAKSNPTIGLGCDGEHLYVEFAGRRVAQRDSGDREWTILVPDFIVTGGVKGDYDTLEISYEGDAPWWKAH